MHTRKRMFISHPPPGTTLFKEGEEKDPSLAVARKLEFDDHNKISSKIDDGVRRDILELRDAWIQKEVRIERLCRQLQRERFFHPSMSPMAARRAFVVSDELEYSSNEEDEGCSDEEGSEFEFDLTDDEEGDDAALEEDEGGRGGVGRVVTPCLERNGENFDTIVHPITL